MWAGTFHSFGLELIQKWPSAVGRSPRLRTFDEAAQLELLEENLDVLTVSTMEEYESLSRRLFLENVNVKHFHTYVAMNCVKTGVSVPMPCGTN